VLIFPSPTEENSGTSVRKDIFVAVGIYSLVWRMFYEHCSFSIHIQRV